MYKDTPRSTTEVKIVVSFVTTKIVPRHIELSRPLLSGNHFQSQEFYSVLLNVTKE